MQSHCEGTRTQSESATQACIALTSATKAFSRSSVTAPCTSRHPSCCLAGRANVQRAAAARTPPAASSSTLRLGGFMLQPPSHPERRQDDGMNRDAEAPQARREFREAAELIVA